MKEREVTLRMVIEKGAIYTYRVSVILEYEYSVGFIFKEWYMRRREISCQLFDKEEEVESLIENEGGAEGYMLDKLIEKIKEVEGDVGSMLNKYQGVTTTVSLGENLLSSIEKISSRYGGEV